MELTKEEEALLNGGRGEAAAKLMRLLVVLGELYEADRMLKVSSVHVSGVSYQNLGDAGLSLLEDLASKGAKVRRNVRVTLNPAGMDLEGWRLMGVSAGFAERQLRVYEAFKQMGLREGLTCTPYEAGNLPAFGEHVAWAESSALAYANSVLGARTNRESGITALASAITGRTPNYGLHLEENRRPTLLVKVEAEVKSEVELGALGYLTGLSYGEAIPYYQGVRVKSLEGFKALSSAAASSGAIALYHVEGQTPEAERFKENLRGLERFKVERDDLKKAFEKFPLDVGFDLVFLGCPHLSLEKLVWVAEKIGGRRVKGKLWLCTSRAVYQRALELGLTEAFKRAGALLLRDTCLVVAPLRELDFKKVLTDSFKAAHYLSGSLEASLASTSQCVRAALEGRVSLDQA
ncbi:MAG: hypothetical protein DRO52_03275 [Candidatus Hecatellales archaeon]|nr:MAG: hypothetical protein DRO52_03275 [Candidatus Hecatellales archaeon]